jgi:hypothetical protein
MDQSIFEHSTVVLAEKIGKEIRAHYLAHERSNDSVFAVLNALAISTGLVLSGTDNDPKAREFFERALADQLRGLAQ